MKTSIQKSFILTLILICCGESFSQTAKNSAKVYVCTPCGYDCDASEYIDSGTCSQCKMALVEKKSIVFKNISPAQLCKIVKKNPNVLLLDVRTPDEFNGKAEENFGRLKNAINIPVQELENRMGELEKYKNKAIIVYCSHSHRSPRASYLMTTKGGFTNVKNMSGGMSVWEESIKNMPESKDLLVK